MFSKNVFKKSKIGTLVAFLSTFTLLASFSVIESKAVSTYYVRTLFDEGSFGMISQVITDKNEGKDWIERDQGVDFSAIADYRKVYKGGGDDKTPGSSLIANIVTNDPTTVEETYAEIKSSSDKNMGLVFSFPGLVQGIDDSIKYTALSSDMARAELVSNTLTKGINDALAFIKTYSGKEHISGEGLRHIVAQLARITAQFENGGGSGTFNTGKTGGSKGFSVFQVTGPNQRINGLRAKVGDELIPVNNLRYTDYVAISTTNSQGEIVYGYYPWRMSKGYHSDQELAPLVGAEYTKVASSKENRYITWGQMAIQAGANADLRGTDIADSTTGVATLIGQGLGADLTGAIVSVRSMLNLAPIQELILNMGARASTHHYGAMTMDMYNTAKTVYVLVFCISLLFLSVLVVKMIHQKMISTTNIIAKTSLMEGLQDVVFIGVMLAIFPSIFELLLEVNYWIVKTFSYSSSYMQAYGITGSKVLATESLAGFMVSSMFLSIDVYINMTYLTRSIILAFLFAISPIMTVSYAWGPMQKKLYFSYMRELVGNIFMQSFHAVTMTFFAGYNTTNMSAMEAIVSTYCFIPVTQMFKQFVIGNQGFAESIGGKLAGQLTNTASGLHKSGVAMKQSKEMMDLQANNAKALADANWKSQMTAFGADMIGMGANSILSNSEIGSKQMGSVGNAMSKSSNGLVSKAGNSLKSSVGQSAVRGMVGTGLSVGAGLIGAKAGSDMMTKANQDANKSLGEMQMKHSMENIGLGLAQAGIGMGVSSFDSGVGNSMIGSGMSTVERGASEYGKGDAYAGTAGTLLAQAEGSRTSADLTTSTLKRTAMTADRAYGKWASGVLEERETNQKEQAKLESRGLDLAQVSNAMNIMSSEADGLFNASKESPIVEMKRHENNTNNVTAKVDIGNLKNATGENAIIDYLQKYKAMGGDMSNPVLAEARDNAMRAGMNMDIGRGTGIVGDITKDSGVVDIVINNIGRYGIEVDNKGNALKASSNLDIGNETRMP